MPNSRIADVLLLLAISSVCFGQKSKEEPVEPSPGPAIRVVDTTPTRIDGSAMLSPQECDADGNIYLRPYSMGFGYRWGQIQKFNPKGENTITFTAPADLIPALYFVSNDGKVFVLAEDRSKRSDGSARWPPMSICCGMGMTARDPRP